MNAFSAVRIPSLRMPAAVSLAFAFLVLSGCGDQGSAERSGPVRLASATVAPPWQPALSDFSISAAPAAPAANAAVERKGAPPASGEDGNAAAERIAKKLADEAAKLKGESAAKAPKDPAVIPKPEPKEAGDAGKELADLGELDPKILDLARVFDFAGAVDLVGKFGAGVKSRMAAKEVERRILDIKAMEAAFDRLIANVAGSEVEIADDVVLKVEKADRQGLTGKIGSATTSRKWSAFPRETILSLCEWDEMSAADEYGIAMLAYAFGMPEEAEKHLMECAASDPSRTSLLGEIIAKRRGAPIGTELSPYKGIWVTGEERALIDKGWERYNDKWMSPEDIMKAKGFVFHNGKWITPQQYDKETKAERVLADLAKKLAPKGLIDKPGADQEQLDWGKRRKFAFPGGHYTIESNLTQDAVKDIAYIMEVLHTNFRKIFAVKSTPHFMVLIGKNQGEYDSILGGGGLGKCGTDGEISTFYQPPNTTLVLMHEGTHQFIFKAAPTCPHWLHEAMASFFECSKFMFNPKTRAMELKTGLLNHWRLGPIQAEIRNKTYTPLRQQINGNIDGLQMYHQGWALIYYLVNAKNGVYAPRVFTYLDKFAGKGGVGRKKGEREDRQVMRFMKAMGIRDMDEFEEDWKKFTLSLDINKSEDFNSGHK